MHLLVAVEQRYQRGSDGHVYAEGPARYSSWAHYLEVFDQVTILARVAPPLSAAAPTSSHPDSPADGGGVAFCALPDYRGPWDYLRQLPRLTPLVRDAVAHSEACILRVPGLVGRLAWHELRRLRRPFALEVVGDPWEAFGKRTWRSAFRPLFRRVAAANLRAMCREAVAVRYVTRSVLQQRYPPAPGAFATSFSDVELHEGFASPAQLAARRDRLRSRPDVGQAATKPLHIGFIGSFAQLYKAPDGFLRALAGCARQGLAFEASMVGDGRYRHDMEKLSRNLGLATRVRFLGVLPYGKAVQEYLDSLDLFVMPSRTEGLPRAMVEALARGCPCLGSAVGGIPELLEEDDTFPANDSVALTRKIAAVAGDPARMLEMSKRNFEKSAEFRPEVLEKRRKEFYCAVRDRSAPAVKG